MLVGILDDILGQVLGFSKRIKNNLNEEPVSANYGALYGRGVELPRLGAWVAGANGGRVRLADQADSLVKPLFYEAKDQIADNGLHSRGPLSH